MDDYGSKTMTDEGSYASDVTRKAKASWERRKMDAIARWGSLDRLASKCSAETAAKFAKANGRMKEARLSADEFEYASQTSRRRHPPPQTRSQTRKSASCTTTDTTCRCTCSRTGLWPRPSPSGCSEHFSRSFLSMSRTVRLLRRMRLGLRLMCRPRSPCCPKNDR